MKKKEALSIISQVRAAGFEKIRAVRIQVLFVKKKDYLMAVSWFGFFYRLYIHKAALEFSPTAFTGCLAHELAHIEHLHSLSIFKRAHSMAQPPSAEEERQTDLMAIQRGYGNELLQFIKEHNQVYKSIKKEDGLTKREVEVILKKGINE